MPGADEGGQPFGFFTGATGVTVDRGDAFPKDFLGDIIVGEVANNLVDRAKLRSDGLRIAADQAEVIARYAPVLQMAGDPLRGKAVFKNHCSACPKLEDVGNSVGPDLASIKNRGSEAVLTNTLDPNREVLSQYFTYLVTTDAGVTITGIFTAETVNTVTLRKADGTTETLQRVNIEQMRSTGLSAMPEGLQQQIRLPTMADLLADLNSIKWQVISKLEPTVPEISSGPG